MRIVHNSIVLPSQQHTISPNPFQEINSTNTTTNYLGSSQITTNINNNNNNNNNEIDATLTTSNINGNTEAIVEKLSSIYGHIDESTTNTILNTTNLLNNSNEINNTNNSSIINTFTNNFNSSYSTTNNFNLNNYNRNPTINYNNYNGNVNDDYGRCNEKNQLNTTTNPGLQQYRNALVNEENNQKTILNNLNRLNGDSNHHHQQQFATSNISQNSNNIIVRENNNSEDLFLENLNVLCAKQDIKSPSSIEDFNIKTITGINKLKSLQFYSDSSSQSSSDDDEIDEIDEDDNNDNDDDGDDDDDERLNESDDNIDNEKPKKFQIINDNHIDNYVDDYDDDDDANNECLKNKNKSLKYRRDSIKLTNKITESDFSNIKVSSTKQIDSDTDNTSFGRNCQPTRRPATSKSSAITFHKMAGDNEKNIKNAEDNENFSETESVEMKSVCDDDIMGYPIEDMEIDKNSEYLDDNLVKDTDNDNDIEIEIENLENPPTETTSGKRRCSSPAGCVLSDRTISEKSFPIEEKATNNTSATSSFASATSSNGTDYPRGIINPNYPGFQHLAHTLSEHFVNHPNDPDDSDLSEFEVELSIDDDIAFSSQDMNISSSIENSITEEKKLNSISLKSASNTKLSQIDDYHHNLMDVSNKVKDVREHKEILLPEIRISFECHDLKLGDRFDFKDSPKRLANSMTTSLEKIPKVNKMEKIKNSKESQKEKKNSNKRGSNENVVDDTTCDLDTYLQKFETATDIKRKNEEKIEQQKVQQRQQLEQKNIKNQSKIIENDSDEGRNCPTPDILIKNCKNDFRRNKISSNSNRPDLLRNVSPQPSTEDYHSLPLTDESSSSVADEKEKFVSQLSDAEQKTNIPETIPIVNNKRTENRDDHSFGTTPVDIVGDFGREIEREFALLVSWYNSKIICRDTSPNNIKQIEGNESASPTKVEKHEKKFINKMADAYLSDAKENINFGSITNVPQNKITGTKPSSMVANIVVARATLNQPATKDIITPKHVDNPCDLLMETTHNKNVAVKSTTNENELKVTMQVQQKQQNQDHKVVEEKLLPSLLVSSTSNTEKPVKKIPPPPPPRRFLQQQLQQMQKRQQELQKLKLEQLQRYQERQKQEQKQQEKLKEKQKQIEEQKNVKNIIKNTNPFISIETANQTELNETKQITTEETTTSILNSPEKFFTTKLISTQPLKQPTDDVQTSAINSIATIVKNNNENNACDTDDNELINKNASLSISNNKITIVIRKVTNLYSDEEETDIEDEHDVKEAAEKQQQVQQKESEIQYPNTKTVVKPKYQKCSYDDRQLPPVGIGVFEQNSRPWYEQQKLKYEKNSNYSTTTTTTPTTANVGESRKIRKNHLNVNSSSYKSDQNSERSNGNTSINNNNNNNNNNNSSDNNEKIVVRKTLKKHNRSIVNDKQHSINKQHHNQTICGNNNWEQIGNVDEDQQKSTTQLNQNLTRFSSRYQNRNFINKNTVLNENTITSSTESDTTVNNNGITASVTTTTNRKKKEQQIPSDDEFIRHDIYKSLTKSYVKQIKNNNNNNQLNYNYIVNDMNNHRGGNGGLLIDNGYHRSIRNDGGTHKYIMNSNNPFNSNYYNKNNNNNSIGIHKNGKNSSSNSASFDVYNIETALPSIDMDAIETHLQKAKEEEKKRRNDREEIRRRLAMGAEDDYFSRMVNNTTSDRPGRKPSLQSRLQNGNNLQICFMNDASSDTESISSDSETCPKLSKSTASSRYSSMSSIATSNPYNSRPLSVNITKNNHNNNNNNIITTNNNGNSHRTLSQRPSTLSLGPPISEEDTESSDFFTKQARLQIEARMALAQAKDMAHMQMEIERQKQKESPITEVIRNSMEKVGVNFPVEKRRVSRQMCTDMNIAQLQIIVNDLHSQIERLNDNLVQFLMERDELHMSQDSMLVDIEDLTRYLSAKEQTISNDNRKNSTESDKNQQISTNGIKNNHSTPQMQSKFQRIANLVKK